MINYQLLNECPVFKGVAENETRKLLQQVHYQVKKFSKGDIVAIAGEQISNLFIILSGSVRGEMIDYSGKTIKIEDIEAPRPLATAFLFGSENRFPVTVTTNNSVEIFSISISELLRLMQLNSVVLKNYLDSISSRTQFISQKLHFLSFKTIKEKIAHYLLQKAGDRLHSFQLNSTQQQLAELFGVTRPSLARVISEMQREKLIIIDKKTVTLLNKQKLNELLRNG
ncbi:cAMP-binding domain of CRP or a regulatory subunit of cAMP-dependent protein kinases [Tangfeifania diversioriginum]|uniref:cAMP-binding domain of CRP or a regulatory subunit of cAMP-dependent protein kinases n=1 Tax=Tangfeifania diversioriginum TaxID=1168035 RepID=A0A1M6GQ20_9BACT|nr:Crp/Fnr family transcriptional regulator [Tangfeifania diversioriginum]SHJ12107.1 cAMP-binding domain of CRP or a regulatory subunit of cAMP-dependent protein kinases [Tangfeifania diversioriginum]